MDTNQADPGTASSRAVAPAEARDAFCPRCGYSLRGLPAPRCPECGLAFDWDDVLQVCQAKESGFIEHCAADRIVPSLVRTWWRALNPFTFWWWVQIVWPVRVLRLIVYATFLLLSTIAVQAFVSSALHFATLHWQHGGRHSLATYAPMLIPFYCRTACSGLLPLLIACVLLCLLRGTVTRYRLNTGHMLRLAIYSASPMLLLPLATAARIVSVIALYPFSPNPDWAVLFWWLVPGGRWSGQVYAHMIPFSWFDLFEPRVEYSDMLRWLTLGCGGVALVSFALRRVRRAGKPWGTCWTWALRVAAAALVVLWPVTTLYVLWLCTLTVGAQRYLRVERGWLVGLTSGVVGVLCAVLFDPSWSDVVINAVQLWP